MVDGSTWNSAFTAAVFLALPAVSSFYTLNFTGCSTYTSRSGVKREMHFGLPAMATALMASSILLLVGRYLL